MHQTRRRCMVMLATAVITLLIVILPSTLSSAATAAEIGAWSAPIDWPSVVVQAALLPNGNVLTWSDRNTANLWNPITTLFQSLPQALVDLLCAGATIMPDGRLLAVGGGGLQTHGFS